VTFSDHDPATVGAYHTGDVPCWLRTRAALNMFRQTRIWEPADLGLEQEMSGALLAFARSGKPVSAKIGPWPRFDPANPKLVWLGEEQRVTDWPHFADLGLFDAAPSAPAPATGKPRD